MESLSKSGGSNCFTMVAMENALCSLNQNCNITKDMPKNNPKSNSNQRELPILKSSPVQNAVKKYASFFVNAAKSLQRFLLVFDQTSRLHQNAFYPKIAPFRVFLFIHFFAISNQNSSPLDTNLKQSNGAALDENCKFTMDTGRRKRATHDDSVAIPQNPLSFPFPFSLFPFPFPTAVIIWIRGRTVPVRGLLSLAKGISAMAEGATKVHSQIKMKKNCIALVLGTPKTTRKSIWSM